MEIELNGAKLRVYECGKIERFGKKKCNSKENWFELKGYILIKKCGYKQHKTQIIGKHYVTSRIIFYAFNPNWNIINNSQNNTIDHINRNSLDNRLINLQIATALEQNLNRNNVINAKGCNLVKTTKKWKAQIKINKKTIHLGCFDTEEEAHQAYLKAKESYQSK